MTVIGLKITKKIFVGEFNAIYIRCGHVVRDFESEAKTR